VAGVVFVVGAERVSSQAARRAIEQLEDVDSRIIGAVLSRADLDRHKYYYAPYYDRKYGHYHQQVASSL
jgi:Mrp family chromosome partitioning ATPase